MQKPMRLFFFKFEPQKRQMMAVKTERREGPEKQIFYFIFFFCLNNQVHNVLKIIITSSTALKTFAKC